MAPPPPRKKLLPRGRRTQQHLATRERPGEIVVVLWFLGFFLFQYAAGGLMVMFWVFKGLTPLALLFLLFPIWLGACFLGLLKGTRWGWWLSCVTLGIFTVLLLFTAVLSMIEGRDEMTFSNSLVGMIFTSVFSLITGAPFLLLVKARQRYMSLSATSNAGKDLPDTSP
jgi:hypothetical protein